jgi:Na+/H+ antiporter NhaD/arsenite permease-like protein
MQSLHCLDCLSYPCLLLLQVVPFVLGMFILVQGLKAVGLVGKLASGLGQAAGSGKLGGALALMGWLR